MGRKNEVLQVGPGVEYDCQAERLYIDVGEYFECATARRDTLVVTSAVREIWRLFQKNFPHRTVRSLVVKGVGK